MKLEDRIRDAIVLIINSHGHPGIAKIAIDRIMEFIKEDKIPLIQALTAIANSNETDLGEYAKFCEETAKEAIK